MLGSLEGFFMLYSFFTWYYEKLLTFKGLRPRKERDMLDVIKRVVEKFDDKIEVKEEVYTASSIEEIEKIRESILPSTGDWHSMQVSCYVMINDRIYMARGKHWCPAYVAGDYYLELENLNDLNDREVFGG